MTQAITPIAPWLQPHWQSLQHQHRSQRLPHALLFTGQAGIGKTQLAQQFANWLLCVEHATHEAACGQCHACRWVQAETYPDRQVVAPEEIGKAIKVDQIRQLTQSLGQTHHIANSYRVILIFRADSMNQAAANALLKSLEEPHDRTVFLLVVDQLWRLPATVISRCQKVPIATPETVVSAPWLAQQLNQTQTQVMALLQRAHGAPLTAKKLVEDDSLVLQDQWVEKLMTRMQRTQFISFDEKALPLTPDVFDWISGWLLDLVRCHWMGASQSLTYDSHREALLQLSRQLAIDHVLHLLQEVLRCKQQYLSGISLNLSLLMDHWLLKLLAAKQRRTSC